MREVRLLTETSTQIHISAWPKTHPLPFQRGAKNNYRNSEFWQVFPSQRFGRGSAPLGRLLSPHLSVTIEFG